MVGPPVGTRDRLGHHQVLPISPPNENIVQQLPAPRSRAHQGGPLQRQKAEEGTVQNEPMFCASSQEEQATVNETAEVMETQHSSPDMVCADADIVLIY
nr:unnamed protein product [Spirometra erinaceieuropaei]